MSAGILFLLTLTVFLAATDDALSGSMFVSGFDCSFGSCLSMLIHWAFTKRPEAVSWIKMMIVPVLNWDRIDWSALSVVVEWASCMKPPIQDSVAKSL